MQFCTQIILNDNCVRTSQLGSRAAGSTSKQDELFEALMLLPVPIYMTW